MSKNLIIVESPAKSKTIKKYLGKDFDVMASYGHVRDLVPKEGAVDPEHNFKMKYQAIEKNEKHIDSIKKAVKKANALYLATDPDREGEAISWHLKELLDEDGLLKEKPVYRVVFHEITKRAVNEAVEHPRELSNDLINAQQARRALDYLVGFNLSPLLWKKIRRGLSAGRVQSPALRLIVEREQEIRAFKAEEYWTIEADLTKAKRNFVGKLSVLNGEKVKQFTLTDSKNALAARDRLLQAAAGVLTVSNIEKKQRKRNPAPPFTTSTLQQEGVRKLGFSASRTMRVAQQLYEGVDIGSGAVGLITYMRTDSVTLANEALTELRKFIEERYGRENLPAEVREYKNKSKNAQEAHEAVRPTSVYNHPDEIKQYLTPDQFKLYSLIWKRTVACQMTHAVLDTVSVDLAAGDGNLFRANGSTINHAGFMTVYQESRDEDATQPEEEDGDEKILPAMEVGEKIDLAAIRADQHFTEPPPRYTEASLVKTLEEHGIGRPSTYASIISTLQAREYVELDKKRFTPTDVGEVVNKFLTNYFTQYVDYAFTAQMEDELDAIARGEKEWVPVMESFWSPFKQKVSQTETDVSRKDVTSETMSEACPKCGKPLETKLGRRGKFIGCSGYPDCDYTRNLNEDANAQPETVDHKCPKCNSDLVIKYGRYGKFIGCSSYPNCKHIESLNKPKDTEVPCPECKQGTILERRSRYGKIFYSCSRYPDCKYAIWNRPIPEPCPKCNWPLTMVKTTKRRGTERVCPQENCKYTEPAEHLAPAPAPDAETTD
ncbi:MAG TPA: type I DNA topoisomerase [Gammaproteobacteria bacterium]|nr:type I DNA topoisomerase [Gammaproteobacteria bacterium]